MRGNKKSGSSKNRLKRWALFAEITGAIAVVMSVGYLALQVSDSNRLLRSQAHYNALDLAQRPIAMMVDNADLASVMLSCESNPRTVDPVAWERCSNYYIIQFNSWEYLYYQNLLNNSH